MRESVAWGTTKKRVSCIWAATTLSAEGVKSIVLQSCLLGLLANERKQPISGSLDLLNTPRKRLIQSGKLDQM
jgi:hypothetical protein